MPLTGLLVGCEGVQSALDPAGDEARRVAVLFFLMLCGAIVIWLLVMGLAVYAARVRPWAHGEVSARRLVRWGGIALPTVLLAVLLGYSLRMMPDLRAPGDGLLIQVSGEQWWWRVAYRAQGSDEAVISANEIRLPVGQRTEIELSSPDVIHSFWIPPLGGKVDMIPGHTTRLVLGPTRTGTFRGICAEFCGTSHALMAFAAVVMEEEAFEHWLAAEAEGATTPGTAKAREGRMLFGQVGCGTCHAIRGTDAIGGIGPDLTHLASRETLASGILPNDRESMARWIADAEAVKPGSKMPSFGMLPAEHLDAIVSYLETLE